jgi:hypothetical protein
MKSNTIFEVVKSEGGRTAWADKHPAYDLVNGPSGKGVDDLFTPEVTNTGGFDNTVSVVCTAQNDALKVQAILNEIHGLTHDGKPGAGVPAVFGMNFQAVSVGQKLVENNKIPTGGIPCPTDAVPPLNGQPGGYTDGSGTPTSVLAYGLQQTDAALGSMIQALKDQGIYESTLFIVSAKHGHRQSTRRRSISLGTLRTSLRRCRTLPQIPQRLRLPVPTRARRPPKPVASSRTTISP